MVSVICNTYNQKDYIQDALDSFLMQKTNFAFEVIVHDDASTDGTAEIVCEYEKRYPRIIKPVYETENQYFKPGDGFFKNSFGRALGKYIAICEGDDFWTDSLKLQKQYDAMETHPEIDMCAHASFRVEADTKKVLAKILRKENDCIIPVEEVIYGGGSYVSTNSLFYRTNIFSIMPTFFTFYPFDYSLQIYGSLRGGMLYLCDIMSAYRFMAKGSWTEHMISDISQYREQLKDEERMLLLLNKETNQKYEKIIQKQIRHNEFEEFCREKNWSKVFSPEYKMFIDEMKFREKLFLQMQYRFPYMYTFLKKK